MIRFLATVGLLALATEAMAQTDENLAGARAEIRVSAAALCQSGSVAGGPDAPRLTDQAGAELSDLMKVLSSFGFDTAAAFERFSNDKATQSELAKSITSGTTCEQAVFERLAETIFGTDSPGSAGAMQTQATVGDASNQDLGPVGDALNDIQGYWYSPRYRYGFAVTGVVGLAIVSNAPRVYVAGDTMLRIDGAEKDTLTGTQVFTNGSWYPVRITLLDANLIGLEGGGFKWEMCRANWDGGRIGDPACVK
ncbi:MAG: hypothetical protein KDE08_11975 [Rhodobacteraceae bacterium]|nr:hypothetical protein [Paracoccaceae bacterium]